MRPPRPAQDSIGLARCRRLFPALISLSVALLCQPLEAAPPGSKATQQGTSSSSQPAPKSDPRDFGLIIPDSGLVRQGAGRRVTVPGGNGHDVVAMIHVDVGDRRLVIMPDGRLSSFADGETKQTNQPFEPASKETIAKDLAANRFAGFRTATTARYLYIYDTSKEFYTATSRIMETMYPSLLAYFKRQKFPVHDPATPLIVIMFETEKEFQEYHPMPSGVVAYYSGVTNHVVMYEQSKLARISPQLALQDSISTIAHEGVHQILANIGVQERLAPWPMWISEGLAEYFAPTTTGERLRWKGVGKVNDLRMFEIDRYLRVRDAKRGDMIEHTVSAARLTSTGYATSWALTHYLAQRKKEKFFAYLTEVSKVRPFESPEAKSDEEHDLLVGQKQLFVKHFGSDFRGMEADLVRYLDGLLAAGKR